MHSPECRIRYYKSGTAGGTRGEGPARDGQARPSGQAGAATGAMRAMAAPHHRHRAVSGNKWYCIQKFAVETEALTMPLDDGLGLDDEQGGSPTVPEFGQPGPEDAVALPQAGAFDGPLKDGQLLAQGQVLHGQGSPVGEQCPQQDADQLYHAHGEAVLSGWKGSIVAVKSIADKRRKCL